MPKLTLMHEFGCAAKQMYGGWGETPEEEDGERKGAKGRNRGGRRGKAPPGTSQERRLTTARPPARRPAPQRKGREEAHMYMGGGKTAQLQVDTVLPTTVS